MVNKLVQFVADDLQNPRVVEPVPDKNRVFEASFTTKGVCEDTGPARHRGSGRRDPRCSVSGETNRKMRLPQIDYEESQAMTAMEVEVWT